MIRESGAPLVEADEPRERRQAMVKPSECRVLPVVLEVGDPTRDTDEVKWTVTEYLVGDVDIATPGIPSLWLHDAASLGPRVACSGSASQDRPVLTDPAILRTHRCTWTHTRDGVCGARARVLR